MLVDNALEHRIVIEVRRLEWLVLLDQTGLDHLVPGGHQSRERTDRDTRIPVQPFQPLRAVRDIEPVEEARGDLGELFRVLRTNSVASAIPVANFSMKS